ncbi:MAG TPA: fumarylacetoacetate hydrolase family protein [Usitatibacter sp.]|nr:fumarylacetoacetate hydrolase family protein [Usitatibacter sp.]
MLLARIKGAAGKPAAAAWIGDRLVELPAWQNPAFQDVSTLMAAGNGALESAQAHAREAIAAGRSVAAESAQFLSPTTPAAFLGLGYNYRALAKNEGLPFNKHPELFAKLPRCAVGHEHPIRVPKVVDKLDFEAELAVVIGRTASRVKAKDALDYVGGYTVCNDLTAKIIPRPVESGSIVVPLKAVDTFGPMGPALIPARGIDPQRLTLVCRVNGQERQRFSTSDMVHTVAEILEYITARMTLDPGDVITTGTSLGIGIIQKPPVFLNEGDVVEVQIEGYPALRNRVEWERE